MVVLPGVLGCRLLRRTVQLRLGSNPAVRGTVARWHAHLCGLATAIHEISGLTRYFSNSCAGKKGWKVLTNGQQENA